MQNPNPGLSLILFPPPDNEPVLLADTPDAEAVRRAVTEQKWGEITFLLLKADEENWLEVSGSLEDGFSARYREHGKEWIANAPPAFPQETMQLLVSYLKRDDRWRTMVGWD